MMFRTVPKGTTSKHAKLYQIQSDPLKMRSEIRYESVRGLRQARNIRLVPDSRPDRMEDGSLAPWAQVSVEVFWGEHVGWKEELVPSARVIPVDALGPNHTIHPFRWTDKEPK